MSPTPTAIPESPSSRPPRIAVLGAGPVGLDAALAALERGFPVRVYEAHSAPGGNVRSWGHVELFTPWAMNVSERMRRRLEAEWDPEGHHTGHEYADRVLDPLWNLPELREGLSLGTRVVAVGREGTLKHEEIGTPARGRRPFRILIQGPDGRERVEHADVVLDCTGKFGHPNTLGDGGIPAPGERSLEEQIRRGIPDFVRDRSEWKGKTVLLAGAGHSAQTAVRELTELGAASGTRVLWLLRKDDPSLGAIPDDPLPLRRTLAQDARSLAAGASPVVEALPGRVVEALEAENGRTRVRVRSGDGGPGSDELLVDRILSLTGGVGDHNLYRQLQVHECYATSGPMKLAAALLGSASQDCLDQESHGADALANPEPGFFILGDKSYGRNNTFLLRTGFQQVDEVFGMLAP